MSNDNTNTNTNTNANTDPAAIAEAEAKKAARAAEAEAKKAARAAEAEAKKAAEAAASTTPELPVKTPEDRAYHPDELSELETEVRAYYKTASSDERPIIKQVINEINNTMVKYRAPYVKGESTSLFVSCNQRRISIKRGETVEIPYYIYKILLNSERQDELSDVRARAKNDEANNGVLANI